MASDETTTPEHEADDDPYHQPHHLLPHGGHSLSRLSVCSSSFTCGNEEDDDDEEDNFYGGTGMSLARLSIENFDADGEFSDSDKDPDSYSLPATPSRRRRPRVAVAKDYASENEAKKGAVRSRRSRRVVRKREEEFSGNSNLELEHDRTFEVPQRLSPSGQSSSGGNSPIASWRISSPGDHPRDVKARLKVWAQAVALVSASQSHSTSSTSN